MRDFVPHMKFKQYSFSDLLQPQTLQILDNEFLAELKSQNVRLYEDLLDYRAGKVFAPIALSELLIAVAKPLELFIAELFHIEIELEKAQKSLLAYSPIFVFKKWFVVRRAKKQLLREQILPSFTELHQWLVSQIDTSFDNQELAIAQYAEKLLATEEIQQDSIDKLTQWCIQAMKTPEGQLHTKDWISFKLPRARDYQRLIPIVNIQGKKQLSPELLRQRDGFDLTDHRMSELSVLNEIHYCIYCHDHNGDLCSKGFKEKQSDAGSFKRNPLNNLLTGCPLEEKISEMHVLKRDAYMIGALAMVMVDNPMCPATGHRICNDCMKACIYQKQEPVNIPEVETRVLTDVLDLPYGVEIYDLLTRWNPLRHKQWSAKAHNGHRILIAGMGPAGFTLAHHLLMEGFAVVGIDGLKIEPLPEAWLTLPIKNFQEIKKKLSERIVLGFGGVAEYGITPRWDKNFLTLIYLNLLRRPYFQLFGNTRFGGTITVETAWELGFDHLAIAVGAGLPKALPVPGSLAKGMRQANDFLMALQLTGAGKTHSVANLELRLPAVVIGGGLTGVDTATEAQAYYIKQVEKIAARYAVLQKKHSEEVIIKKLNISSKKLLEEFLLHASLISAEREKAALNNTMPDFVSIIRKLGGVSIIYRKTMEESPAYLGNHEELHKSLEEGIFYCENYQPIKVILDEFQEVKGLLCEHRETKAQVLFEARTILVATGAYLNIAYEFEHKGTFERKQMQYVNHELINSQLIPLSAEAHVKSTQIGGFTSYHRGNKWITFLGDSHPVFHGSVVNAIASALRIYPKIVDLFKDSVSCQHKINTYNNFRDTMNKLFESIIVDKKEFFHITEITVCSPLAAQQWNPGEFYRLQNFETYAFPMEALALTAFNVDKEQGLLSFMIQHKGASSLLAKQLQIGEKIALMGPTGVRSKIVENQTILIAGGQLSLAYLRAVAPALKAAGNQIIYLGIFKDPADFYCQSIVTQLTDHSMDCSQDNWIETLTNFFNDYVDISLDRVTIVGTPELLEQFKQAMIHGLTPYLAQSKIFGSAYVPMQCMLKGVCSQCLTWQLDPQTGERKKAVYCCSWQDQPLEFIDTQHLEERLKQNQLGEIISELWVNDIIETL